VNYKSQDLEFSLLNSISEIFEMDQTIIRYSICSNDVF